METANIFEDDEPIDYSQMPNVQPVPGDESTKPAKTSNTRKSRATIPIIEGERRMKYILMETVLDKHNIIRRRVPLTPSMCTVPRCGFDIAVTNGFESGWSGVPEDQRQKLLAALQKHIQLVHTSSLEAVIEEDDLQTEWLGIKGRKA